MSNDNTRIRMETFNTSHKLLCIDYSNSFNYNQTVSLAVVVISSSESSIIRNR